MFLFWHYLKTQFEAEENQKSLWLVVLFATGIGIYFALPTEPSIWWTLGVIETLILLAIILRYRAAWLYSLIIPAFVIFGFTTIQLRSVYQAQFLHPVPDQKLYLTGKITALDYNSRGNQRMVLEEMHDYNGKEVKGTFRLSLRRQRGTLQTGQCVELIAEVMPLPKAVLPDAYQFDRKSFYQGLTGSGYSVSRVLPVDCPQESTIAQRLSFAIDDWRQKIIAHIKKVLPPNEASITAAIIAGEQGGIKKSLIQNYRDSGLAHFLSISGLHMSMLAGLMFFFIRLLIALIPPLALRYDSKKISAVFAIAFSAVYLLISGAAIPAQRAFIMTFIVLLGVLFSRLAISMKTISWAAFIVLFIAPEALIGASFQMSFAAVVCLIAFYERYAGAIQRFFKGGNREDSLRRKIAKIIFAYIVGILVSDLVASLATLPFAIYHFNRIAVFTTLANLLAGPIIGLLIMPFTLLSLLLMPFGLDGWCLQIVGFGVAQVNWITGYVSSLPHAGLPVLAMPLWGLLLIVYGVLWLALWHQKWRRWGAVAVVVGVCSLFTVSSPDALINEDADVFAVKDNQGQLVIMPGRGNNFIKQIWREKMASPKLTAKQNKRLKEIYQGKVADKDWLDLSCDAYRCLYKDRIRFFKKGGLEVFDQPFDAKEELGAAFYLNGDKVRVKSVRDDIGNRLWNQ